MIFLEHLLLQSLNCPFLQGPSIQMGGGGEKNRGYTIQTQKYAIVKD